MLKRVEIKGFRCLRRVSLELEPLTVLVGPNGSGKTTIVEALEPSRGIEPDDLFQRHAIHAVRSWTLSNGTGDRHASRAGAAWGGPWERAHLDLRPEKLRQQNTVQQAWSLRRDGDNLTNVLATLSRREREALSQALCDMVPLFNDVDVRPSPGHAGTHRLVFQDRWAHDVWYEPEQVSDGTLLMLAFLTLGYLAKPPDLVTIESPEHSLHPYLVGELIGMLRKLAEGALGKKAIQVVLTTHSPQVLEFVRPEEVRFVSRSLADGGTKIERAPTDTEAFKQAFEAYERSLGELWLSGNLGGVPAAGDAS